MSVRKLLIVILALAGCFAAQAQEPARAIQTASAPLYRDPVYDGVADPVVVWNRDEGSWWMLTDEWSGMRVYRSDDADHWEKQDRILEKPSGRCEDGPSGAHGDVVVVGDKAYVFYFTHPDRKSHLEAQIDESGNIPYRLRRSSAQVAELLVKDGKLVADQSADFDFYLPSLQTENHAEKSDGKR